MTNLSQQIQANPARRALASKRLSHWHELLEEWCLIHERYCRLVKCDSIYWNIERSNLAALAGAAWRSGWAALEEFSQYKRVKATRFDGRADLYLKSPDTEDYVESKMVWPRSGHRAADAKRTLACSATMFGCARPAFGRRQGNARRRRLRCSISPLRK